MTADAGFRVLKRRMNDQRRKLNRSWRSIYQIKRGRFRGHGTGRKTSLTWWTYEEAKQDRRAGFDEGSGLTKHTIDETRLGCDVVLATAVSKEEWFERIEEKVKVNIKIGKDTKIVEQVEDESTSWVQKKY